MFKRAIAALALAIGLALPARADTTTTNYGFIIPTTGSYNWAVKINDWVIKIDSACAGYFHNNTYFSSATYNAPVLMAGTSTQYTGPNGYIVLQSSVSTTGGIFGGSGTFTQALSALSGAFTNAVSAVNGWFSGAITASSGTFTTNGANASVSGSSAAFTGSGSAAPFDVTITSGLYVGGELKLGSGAYINWTDGKTSTTTGSGGSGGGGGHVYSTATISGGAVQASGQFVVPVETGTAFDAAGFSLTDDPISHNTIVQVKNLTAIATASSTPSGTTSSTSLGPCMAGSTAPFNTGNNPVMVCYAGAGSVSTTAEGASGLLVDGIMISSVSQVANSANAVNLGQCAITPTLAAGAHNACVTFATNAGTLTVPNNSGAKTGSKMSVVELNTSGSGYTVPVSTTVYPNGTISSSQTKMSVCVAGSTATWNATTNSALICADLSVSIAGHGNIGLLLDGNLLPGFSNVQGFGDTSGGGGTYSFCYLAALASTGTHNTCVTGFNNGATMTIPAALTTASVSTLHVVEVRTTAGGGDLSSNGTWVASGQDSFTQGLALGGQTQPLASGEGLAATGVLTSSTTMPTMTAGSGSFGTGSNNQSGSITTSAGTAIYTITFSKAWNHLNSCVCTSTARSWWTSAISNTAFTCTNGGTGETGTTFTYICMGAP